MVTRSTSSIVTTSPENIRQTSDYSPEEYVIDTPVSVHKEEYQVSPSMVDIKVEDQDNSQDNLSENSEHSNVIPVASVNRDKNGCNITAFEPFDDYDTQSQDSDDSRLSDRATTYRAGPRPISRICSYCARSRNIKIYQCNKDRCHRKICDDCTRHHKRRRKYLTDFDTGHCFKS